MPAKSVTPITRIYAAVCVLFALASAWIGIGRWLKRQPPDVAEFLVFALIAVFFATTSLALFRGGRFAAGLAVLSALLLGLHGLVVVLHSWEHLGAPAAIPLALGSFVGAGLGIMTAIEVWRARARPA